MLKNFHLALTVLYSPISPSEVAYKWGIKKGTVGEGKGNGGFPF